MLENYVKDKQGKYEGVYTFEGLSDGIDYWVDADGAHAMWYLESGSNYYWQIGYLVDLGTYTVAMYASSMLEKKCPNNEGYVWDWFYSNNGFQATNDIYIKCANEDDFCSSENPCDSKSAWDIRSRCFNFETQLNHEISNKRIGLDAVQSPHPSIIKMLRVTPLKYVPLFVLSLPPFSLYFGIISNITVHLCIFGISGASGRV